VKVKISYTVDVESIPTEVENVVDKIDALSFPALVIVL
jgi:hypothetical protein